MFVKFVQIISKELAVNQHIHKLFLKRMPIVKVSPGCFFPELAVIGRASDQLMLVRRGDAERSDVLG